MHAPFTIPAEIVDGTEPVVLDMSIAGLHDSLVVDRAAQTITDMLEWRGEIDDSREGLPLVKAILSMLIERTYLQENESQITPCDEEDEAFVKELISRLNQHDG